MGLNFNIYINMYTQFTESDNIIAIFFLVFPIEDRCKYNRAIKSCWFVSDLISVGMENIKFALYFTVHRRKEWK